MRTSGEVEEQSQPLACSFLRTQSWVTTRPRQVAVLQQQIMGSQHNELPRNGHAVTGSCDLAKCWPERMIM